MEIAIISIAIVSAVFAIFKTIQVFGLKDENETLNKQLAEHKDQNQKYLLELNEKKLESLKFTLNPHSFKNTLESIEHVAKNTLVSVNSLTVILDYMLYETQERYVPIEREIDFAKKYFKLYDLKVSPIVNTRFQIDDRFSDKEYQFLRIAPLITAHFIENAFKHADLESDDAFIELKLELIHPSSIVYSIRNKTKISSVRSHTGGIGTGNFQERLKLLYPDKYHLDTKTEDGIYSSNLKIEL